jgi:hypothetical protein
LQLVTTADLTITMSNGSAAFRARDATRTLTGQALTGHIRRSGTGVRATCGVTGMHLVRALTDGATLSLEGFV